MSEDLEAIETALRDRAAARTNLRRAVLRARESGCTWTAIAGVFGVSRQAVTERFGAKEADVTEQGATRPAECD